MINIDVILTPVFINKHNTQNNIIIVVDVLRATTSITTMLYRNANSIVPINSFEIFGINKKTITQKFLESKEFEEIIRKFKEEHPEFILAGEIDSLKIPNFDYGNSPSEFYQAEFNDKKILLFTTNGTPTLRYFENYENVFVTSFLNYGFIADVVGMMKKNITIVCSGDNNNISYEDLLLAGALIQEFHEIFNFNVRLTDTAKISLYNYLHNANNLSKTLKETSHALELMEKGFFKDIEFASKLNIMNIIPFYKDGIITSL